MHWLKNLSVSTRIFIGFLVMVVFLLVVGYIGIRNITTIDKNDDLIYEKSVVPLSQLVDIAAYFQRGRSITRDLIVLTEPKEIQDETKNIYSKYDIMKVAMDSFEQRINTKEIKEAFEEFKEIHKKYMDGVADIIALGTANKDKEAWAYIGGSFDDLVMKEVKIIEKLVKLQKEYALDLSDKNTSLASSSEQSLTLLLIIGSVVALLLSLLFSRIIGQKTVWYEALLDAIPMPMSVTDMNMNWTFINKQVESFLKVKRKDVVGKQCSEWNAKICKTEDCGIERLRKNKPLTFFEQFGGYFRVDSSYVLDKKGKKIGHIEFVQDNTDLFKQTELIKQSAGRMLEFSEQSATSSSELQTSASTAASSSEEISANINSVSSAAEEMASSIKEIAKNTNNTAKITEEATQKASATNQVMNRLGESSTEIGNIVKIITSIAEQTNLLALNATIEAARAGESGKGFAVVANEVKELAKESAKATEDITNKIKAIQEDSTNAIHAIREIIEITKNINDISNTVASAIEEQTVTISEINRNLSEVTKGSGAIAEANAGISNSANDYAKLSSQVKLTAQELGGLADKLESNLRVS